MKENPAATDWSAERGEKWLAQLAGMEAMLAPVDEPLIQALRLDAAWRIADIGCGGGGTTREILRRAPVGSAVHGFDLSPGLIEVARRLQRAEERAAAFAVANMATASAPDILYDRLVSRFGIMFFDDPLAAFANLAGWLAPGGRFAFAVWGRLAENPWMTSAREVVAEIIHLPAPDLEAPGPFRYGQPYKLLHLLEQTGYGDLEIREWRGVLPVGGGLAAAEAASFALASFSSFGELLTDAGDKALQHARQALTARLSRHEQDGSVGMDASVHIVTGAR